MGSFLTKYRDLISKSKYVLFLNITDRVYSFLVLLFIAREYSPEQYGETITLFTLAMVMQMVFDLGVPAFVQRDLAANGNNLEGSFGTAFFFTLLLFPIYFGTSYILKHLLYPQIDLTLFLIIFIFMYGASVINLCNKALSGKNAFRPQFYALLISRLYIVLMFVIGLFITGISIIELMLVILTGFFLNIVLVLRSINKNAIKIRFDSFNIRRMKAIVSASIPMGLAVIFNFMYDKIDVLLLSKLKDFSQVAYYNIGYGVYKSSSLGFSFLLVAAYTKISYISSDKPAVREFFYGLFKLVAAICTVISVVLFIFPEPIVNALYTERYSDASLVVRILAVGLVGLGLNNLTGITLNGMGFFKIVMYITLYGLVLNVLLNILFIPVYGIVACSVITVLTEYFIFFTQYHYLKKILKAQIGDL